MVTLVPHEKHKLHVLLQMMSYTLQPDLVSMAGGPDDELWRLVRKGVAPAFSTAAVRCALLDLMIHHGCSMRTCMLPGIEMHMPPSATKCLPLSGCFDLHILLYQ